MTAAAIVSISSFSVAACRAPHRETRSGRRFRQTRASARCSNRSAHRPSPSPSKSAAAERGSQTPLPTVELPRSRAPADRPNRAVEQRARARPATPSTARCSDRRAACGSADGWMSSPDGGMFTAAYRVTPIVWSVHGSAGHIAGYYTRARRRDAHWATCSFRSSRTPAWRIAAETPTIGSLTPPPDHGRATVAQFDAAGIRRVSCSLARIPVRQSAWQAGGE
jgi:hypothetical protein